MEPFGLPCSEVFSALKLIRDRGLGRGSKVCSGDRAPSPLLNTGEAMEGMTGVEIAGEDRNCDGSGVGFGAKRAISGAKVTCSLSESDVCVPSCDGLE